MTKVLGWEAIEGPRAYLATEASLTLPRKQAVVIMSLLLEHEAFQPPEPPISYGVIASAMEVSLSTVKTHLRRVRQKHPDLYCSVMAIRLRDFDAYHAFVREARRERSRRWGRRRWIAQYRREHGYSPWEFDATDLTRSGVDRARAFWCEYVRNPE